LGGEDFARDIEAVRTPSGEEIALARMRVVLGARAAGVLPIDTVYTDFRDVAGLSRDAERARRLGFAGKLVIHPRQVGTVNRAFSPSSSETRRAREVVAAFEAARERGEAVAHLEGRMLDPAVVDQARRVVELAEEQSRVEAMS
jgi:citrate lyase subunit beta/citryl-CoA lyase